MTDPAQTPTGETPAGIPPAPAAAGTGTDEEAFHIPDDLALALTEFAAVEQLSRGEAICRILRESLRVKGYLRGSGPA